MIKRVKYVQAPEIECQQNKRTDLEIIITFNESVQGKEAVN